MSAHRPKCRCWTCLTPDERANFTLTPCEADAYVRTLRPIDKDTRVVAIARICGDRVLSVRYESRGKAVDHG